MFKRRPWGHLKIKLALLLLCILVLSVLGRAADIGPLPANNWNPANLTRIKVSAAKPLTFAVLGDDRDNPAVFDPLLQRGGSGPYHYLCRSFGRYGKEGGPGPVSHLL